MNQYFEILRSVKKGGLSLWLNRRTLMPLTILPVIVTCLTLGFIRSGFIEDVSPFILAVIQIPSDLVIGLLCALIILIIMNAPKKDDKAGPVMFTLNIIDQKQLILMGAVAHVVVSYLFSGIYGLTGLLYEDMKVATDEGQQPPLMPMVGVIVLLVVLFYAVRFSLLPMLLVGKIDPVAFYRRNPGFGLSVPLFFVKALVMIGTGLVLLFVLSFFPNALLPEGQVSMVEAILADLVTSVFAVVSQVMAAACLAVGLRQMLEKK